MNLSVFEKAGIEVTEQGTVSEVFKKTQLDWEVEQQDIYSRECDGEYQLIRSLVANYRSDTNQFLGVVHPKTYRVVQNIDAFNFIDGLDGFTFEKVGDFQGGKKVFVVGKSNEQVLLDGSDDPINFYLTFLHGHDGKSGIRFILCPVRMFCMNQFNLMLESATFKYNIAHTGNINVKIALVKKAIDNSKDYVKGLQSELDNLIAGVPNLSIDDFVDKLIPDLDDDSKLIISRKETIRDAIIDLYKNKDDLQNYKNTDFGYISAVSDYVSHLNPQRSGNINNAFIKNIEGNTLLHDAYNIIKAA